MNSLPDQQAEAPVASVTALKDLLGRKDSEFYRTMYEATQRATTFGEVLTLHKLRRRADAAGLAPAARSVFRVAMAGGANLRPLADLVEHFTATFCSATVEVWVGEYDSYTSEIMEPQSELYAFKPDVLLLLPAAGRYRYTGSLLDGPSQPTMQGDAAVRELLELCRVANERSGAEVVLCNFILPATFDPGSMRSSLASEYGFRKYLNLELGLRSSRPVHICDAEFLANRLGTQRALDERAWFESKQPFSIDMAVQVAREFAHLVVAFKQPAKKVLVLDLDNTLWGGVIGDDGIEGIEIGTTSPRGEAFRHFQQYILSLSRRGILLAVCSKNDHDKAIEPFVSHPEMVLRSGDIVSFKANWEPKSDNIRQIAAELNLGLDSFVFADDNPAEIEIVRQFVPEVTGICLGDDPSRFTALLQDCRLFEVSSLTQEDIDRVSLYKSEAVREQLRAESTDMDSYLASLGMVGYLTPFVAVDAPRIAQLTNKSNQFNLTTVRRSESEILHIMRAGEFETFTMRLTDKFGDHGLILVVIGRVEGEDFTIDTWLMSCRVLKRGVEQETLNEIMRLARKRGCRRILGTYLPTKKNSMVSDLYPRLGFAPSPTIAGSYLLTGFEETTLASHIRIERGSE
jgi:FkbH-like protein